MNAAIWIAIAAVIVAVIGIGATVFAARRWGNRRRRILFAWESVPLLAADADDGLLEVTYRDFPVKDPHLVTVRIANVGPTDVASDSFDAGRSVMVRLNCTMYGVTRTTHPQYTVGRAIGAEGELELRPCLLRTGEEWIVEVVTQGEGRPELDLSLIDTDVIEGPGTMQQLAEQIAAAALTVTLPFGVQIQLRR